MADMQHLRADIPWCREVLDSHRGYPTILVSHDIMYAVHNGKVNEPKLSENGA